MLGWLLLSFFAITAMDLSATTSLASFGGIAIYPSDVVAIVLVGAIVTTPAALGRIDSAELCLWVPVLSLMGLSLVRGMSSFGLAVAGNEARGLAAVAGATLWCWGRMRLSGAQRDLKRWGVVTALGLTGLRPPAHLPARPRKCDRVHLG